MSKEMSSAATMNKQLHNLQEETRKYFWRPFALKDTRELVRDGVLNGSVTRLRDRLSKAAAVFQIKRVVLWSTETNEQDKRALMLLVFLAEAENPHHVRLYFHQSPDLQLADLGNPCISELREYFVSEAFWRISSYVKVMNGDDRDAYSETAAFLSRLDFEKEARLPDFFLDGMSPQAADLWRWNIDQSDFEAFFLPFGDGALVVAGNRSEVKEIYFLAYGERIADARTFLKAYKLGFADKEAKLSRVKNEKKPHLSANMSLAYDELDRYLAGQNKSFSFRVQKSGGSEFQRHVWTLLDTIPYGATNSYLDIARKMVQGDETKAHRLARAVGSACGANPLCIVTPCHRVIGSDNSLTGFNGGVHFKARLLDMELLGQSGKDNE